MTFTCWFSPRFWSSQKPVFNQINSIHKISRKNFRTTETKSIGPENIPAVLEKFCAFSQGYSSAVTTLASTWQCANLHRKFRTNSLQLIVAQSISDNHSPIKMSNKKKSCLLYLMNRLKTESLCSFIPQYFAMSIILPSESSIILHLGWSPSAMFLNISSCLSSWSLQLSTSLPIKIQLDEALVSFH